MAEEYEAQIEADTSHRLVVESSEGEGAVGTCSCGWHVDVSGPLQRGEDGQLRAVKPAGWPSGRDSVGRAWNEHLRSSARIFVKRIA